MKRSAEVIELLDSLAYENPPPEESWYTEGDWDPRFLRRAIRAAERSGLIEIDREHAAESSVRAEEGEWSIRFTAKGRAALAAETEAA